MGKRKQREQPRTQARDFREPRENVWKQSKTEGGDGGDNRGGRGFAEAVKDSAIFQAYYKARFGFCRPVQLVARRSFCSCSRLRLLLSAL